MVFVMSGDAQKTYSMGRKAGWSTDRIWTVMCAEKLHGRTIKKVRYLTDDEMETLGWYEKSLVIFLDDGNFIFASSDDEGNAAGALFTSYDDMPTIPVVYPERSKEDA
jgi:hypothetical protein